MEVDPAEAVPAVGPSPDPLLAQYGSDRPPVELLPGVSLSPIVNACWLPKDAKVTHQPGKSALVAHVMMRLLFDMASSQGFFRVLGFQRYPDGAEETIEP